MDSGKKLTAIWPAQDANTSSHPYVTQQNTPLADSTTLMSTADLWSYTTHASDTLVQVSDYTLQKL